jgi:hypothetical protein
VKRIVWLPDPGAREALLEALRSAGASLHDLPPGADARRVG